MVIKVKEEFVSASIQKQIQSLKNVIEELEMERLTGEALAWRLRAVELGLRHVREAA